MCVFVSQEEVDAYVNKSIAARRRIAAECLRYDDVIESPMALAHIRQCAQLHSRDDSDNRPGRARRRVGRPQREQSRGFARLFLVFLVLFRLGPASDWGAMGQAGPGNDFFEDSYGIYDMIQSLLGSSFYRTETLFMTMDNSDETVAFSAEFYDYVEGIEHKKTLLDHVFVSRALRAHVVRGQVCHDAYQRALLNDGRRRDERASDHRPVVVDFDLRKK